MIYHIKSPATPHLRFEWHEGSKRLYLIRVGHVPERGELIAENVEDHGLAYNITNAWIRGYKSAKMELPNG